MPNNYDYPVGADNSSAPWNKPDVPEQEFVITVSQTISRQYTVTTTDYNIDEYEEPESGVKDIVPDTEDTDWNQVFEDNECRTPLQLIQLFKRYLEDELTHRGIMPKSPSFLKQLIKQCDDWTEDDCEIMED